jgi:hypothetical protein
MVFASVVRTPRARLAQLNFSTTVHDRAVSSCTQPPHQQRDCEGSAGSQSTPLSEFAVASSTHRRCHSTRRGHL